MDSKTSHIRAIVVNLESVGNIDSRLQDNGGNIGSQPTTRGDVNVAAERIVPEYDGKQLFDSGDGDIELWVNGLCFETHKDLLKRFCGLKDLLAKHTPGTAFLVHHDKLDAEGFRHMFKLLYASILEGPFEFDSTTLVSALRVAKAYGYPTLRAYTIKHLESVDLIAVEGIKIAREFGLEPWEGPAYVELCERDEAITMEEANVLGLDAFVHIARIREKDQRRKGKEVDTQEDSREGGSSALVDSSDEQGKGVVFGETPPRLKI